MKIKKYVADSMNDALMQIKQELGSDAVILNSKQIKNGGFLGMFKKSRIEVIAAMDEHPIQKIKQPTPKMRSQKTKGQIVPEMKTDREYQQVLQEIKQLQQLIASKTFQGNNPFNVPFD